MPDQHLAPPRPVKPGSNGAVQPRPAPPPRPRVTSDLPLPGRLPGLPGTATPRAVHAAQWLWALSLVAGVVAVAVSVIDRDRLHTALVDSARADDPAAAENILQNGATLAMAGMALLCAGLLFVTFCALRLSVRRRSGARWALLASGVATLVAADGAQGMVHGGATDLDRMAFLVQAGLIVLAGATLLTRSSRDWLRRPLR